MAREATDMAAEGADTDRTEVKTYVPAYQKDEWRTHADELDMSQSEFVRSMVQAGRRNFETKSEGGQDSPSNPRGNDLESRVLEVLRESGHSSWEELVAALTDNLEDRLDETLAELQDRNAIRYSGRDGGYTVVEP